MRGIRRLLVALMVVGMMISGVSAAFADEGGRPNANAGTVRICHVASAGHEDDFRAGGPGGVRRCEMVGGMLMRVAGQGGVNGHGVILPV